ncbi:MAG: hypothetical protein OQK78_12650 [Gammaproteobacteria bacterium]|nr:hypothetical protein [Gammaproteobacteria bacterium]
MNFVKREWLAALPYLLILILIINVHILGLQDVSVAGINISLYSLAPLILYYLLMMRNQDLLVQHHMVASVGNLFVYLVLSSLYSGVMYMLGYRVGVLNMELLSAANFNTWIAIGPLIAILVHTAMTSVHGIIQALKQQYPESAHQEAS